GLRPSFVYPRLVLRRKRLVQQIQGIDFAEVWFAAPEEAEVERIVGGFHQRCGKWVVGEREVLPGRFDDRRGERCARNFADGLVDDLLRLVRISVDEIRRLNLCPEERFDNIRMVLQEFRADTRLVTTN